MLPLDTNPETWSVPCRALEHGIAGVPSGNNVTMLTREKTRSTEASRESTKEGISRLFPLFRPYSSDTPGLDGLTIQSVNQAMPYLGLIAEHLHGKKLEIANIDDFGITTGDRQGVSAIKEIFDRHGSDKANYHNYHEFYGCILGDRRNVHSILEIGLGTNNTDIACNMGSGGKPGASLRAFRDHFPEALIYGADIDHSILFEEERIRTFHVDQTDPESFEKLAGLLPEEIDLVIDDGLHAPNANLLTLLFGLKKISPGGWVVIEDVTSPVIWQTVAALLPENLKPYFFRANHGMIFAVQRLS